MAKTTVGGMLLRDMAKRSREGCDNLGDHTLLVKITTSTIGNDEAARIVELGDFADDEHGFADYCLAIADLVDAYAEGRSPAPL